MIETAERRHVLVVDEALPATPVDGGSLRMARLLSALAALGWHVTAAAPGAAATPAFRRAGIEVVGGPVEQHLRRLGHRYEAVVLSRPAVAGELIEKVRKLVPRALVVYDTLDLHFVREFRRAKLLRSSGLLRLAIERKREELALIAAADRTLVVSEAEKAALAQECPGAQVHVVSNVHEVARSPRGFDGRRGVVFVGHFQHEPNVDAAGYLLEDVWPLIRSEAGLELSVVGAQPPRWLRSRPREGVTVTGEVRDVRPYLDGSRLSIAPLRFGAGVKGKVLESMGLGLPVAGSTLAFEGIAGYGLPPAPDAEGLAAATLAIHSDRSLWQRLATGGIEIVERHFSAAAAGEALAAALAPELAHV